MFLRLRLLDKGRSVRYVVVEHLQIINKQLSKPKEVYYKLAYLTQNVLVNCLYALAKAVTLIVYSSKGHYAALYKHTAVANAVGAVLALYRRNLSSTA